MAEVVATVKTVKGEVLVSRSGVQQTVKTGDHLYQEDQIVTKGGSSVGIIFRDDTLLSLGSNTELRIDKFVFDPAAGDMGFLTTIGKGTAEFISGQMAKLSPDAMSVQTPLSTLGIRGTRFLVKVD